MGTPNKNKEEILSLWSNYEGSQVKFSKEYFEKYNYKNSESMRSALKRWIAPKNKKLKASVEIEKKIVGKQERDVQIEQTKEGWKLNYSGTQRCTNEEEARAFHNISKDEYDCIKQKPGWNDVTLNLGNGETKVMTNYKFSCEFVRKKEKRGIDIDKLFEKYDNYKPKVYVLKKLIKPSKVEATLNLYDAHIDKIAFVRQTGKRATIKQNLKTYNDCLDDLLSRAANEKPSQFIYPVGNDLFNVNNSFGTTLKGTPMPEYMPHNETYDIICDLIIESIFKILQVAPVKVVMVQGNHDWENVTKLGGWLQRFFGRTKGFSIVNSEQNIKYHSYGNALMAFTHGEKIAPAEYARIVPFEQKKQWAKTKYCKVHCGHLHRNKKLQLLRSHDYGSVEVHYLRGLSATDFYHHKNGWMGTPRTGTCEIWSSASGIVNSFTKNFV